MSRTQLTRQRDGTWKAMQPAVRLPNGLHANISVIRESREEAMARLTAKVASLRGEA